jgi:hypothetical protein
LRAAFVGVQLRNSRRSDMVIKNDPRKVLELLGTKHRETGERGLCEQRAFGRRSLTRLRHG